VSVLVLGLNYRTAPVELLEQVAVPHERLSKALASLTARDHVLEAAVLSTCNRVEVYAHVSRYHGGVADLRHFFAEWGGLAPEEFVDHTYDQYDDRAAAHLFAVAGGLDSMVVGERQIHLQVRHALRDAQDEGAAGRVLQTLFRRAIRVGKRTRVETAISAGASSMVDVGIDAAVGVLGPLTGRTILVVGAGKMGGMAAARLAGDAGRVLVANRTVHRAERLAERVAGEVLPLDDLATGLAAADLVVCSTGAPDAVISSSQVAAAMGGRTERPLVLVDLAVPRDVEPGAAEVAGVTVLDVDAIRAVTDSGATGDELARARAIVEEEATRFAAWSRGVHVDPAIAGLRNRAEAVRNAELARLKGRLGDLDPRQRDAVEALTRGILNTLLHTPSVRLRELADRGAADLHVEALRELFDLDPPGESQDLSDE
jgi:glutamyl-tRNA reductase